MADNKYTHDDEFMAWEDAFEADATAPEWKPLPAGTYPFVIEDVERSYVPDKKADGNDRMYGGCPEAIVTLRVTGKNEDGNEVEAKITDKFTLHHNFKWKISQLFISVGLVKQGEQLRMNWPALVTRGGQCEVSIREYKGKDGKMKQTNQINRYCDPSTTAPAWKRGF